MRSASVACFSYLAATQTLYVDTYPKLNYGVEIESTDRFIAGDGPLVAGMLAAFGHTSTLFSNPVGIDGDGQRITDLLASWNVNHKPGPTAVSSTRVNTVVADRAGNRTWFSGLSGVTDELADVDIAAITEREVIYLDCYEVLADTPRRILVGALEAGRDVVVNLGGSPPAPWLKDVAKGGRVAVVQTNGDEHDPRDRETILSGLCAENVAEVVIVTAGRAGAIARTRQGAEFSAPAVPVQVHQVQGAGSAFSAALIHARSEGQSIAEAIRFACRVGSLWCARIPHGPLPRLEEVEHG